jgi:K+-sensing histidine kinase KdpD
MASRAWQGQQRGPDLVGLGELARLSCLLGQLLAAVSHDLRTPLAGIKAAVSSLLQEDVDWTAEEQRELLLTVDESADRLTDLISNILAMSRIQAGGLSVQVSPVALDEVVAQALLGSEANVTVDVPEDLPLVLADAGLLERVVANLVDNACRFSPPGVPVAIHAEPPAGATTGPAVTGAPRGCVRLHVTDHGPGIPKTERHNMFTAFQRLGDHDAGAGLGLGLAIAQGFTQAMHAQLSPSDTVGGGLTMTITLPVAE